ncbi:hypothetical protein ABZ281_43580 [Streptomyces sp. NPDC006265]|uniref:hypothetical protein n=1 Tax=Streptomyces sp. NPDC006265 TaxID=3156740 RepID=UPI0033B5A75F
MTIERRYSGEENLGILSVAGHLGGAMGWVLGRGAGPVVADLTELRSCSAEGQATIIEAARHIAASGRSLEPAVIPADGSLVPDGHCPAISVHTGLAFERQANGMASPGERPTSVRFPYGRFGLTGVGGEDGPMALTSGWTRCVGVRSAGPFCQVREGTAR